MLNISTHEDRKQYATELYITFGRQASKVVLELIKAVPTGSTEYHQLFEVMNFVDDMDRKIRDSLYGNK